MYQLLETIKIFNNQIFNVELHNERFNNARKTLFDCNDKINLLNYIGIPENLDPLKPIKCRVLYSKLVNQITYEQYTRKEINSLKLINCDTINYAYKFSNRDQINELYQLKLNSDDIIIVKQGYITDTSYCNIVCYDGNRYFTSNTPLLKGTKRQLYINQGLISETEIKVKDLKLFRKIYLVNAMIDLLDCEIDISNILF